MIATWGGARLVAAPALRLSQMNMRRLDRASQAAAQSRISTNCMIDGQSLHGQ
jgi:hypothetical protein